VACSRFCRGSASSSSNNRRLSWPQALRRLAALGVPDFVERRPSRSFSRLSRCTLPPGGLNPLTFRSRARGFSFSRKQHLLAAPIRYATSSGGDSLIAPSDTASVQATYSPAPACRSAAHISHNDSLDTDTARASCAAGISQNKTGSQDSDLRNANTAPISNCDPSRCARNSCSSAYSHFSCHSVPHRPRTFPPAAG